MEKPIKRIYIKKGSFEIIKNEPIKSEINPVYPMNFTAKASFDSPLVKSLLILEALASDKRS